MTTSSPWRRACVGNTWIIAAFFALATVITSTHADPVELHVMSFNILQDLGASSAVANSWIYTGGPNRRERAVRIIAESAPDILGLQEAEENQVAELTSTNALSAYGFYGFGRDDAEGNGLHEGVFYRTNRFVRTDQGAFWLSLTPDTPGSRYPGVSQIRIAVWVRLTDRQSGRAYLVMSTHFDHTSPAARSYSAGLVRERLHALAPDIPVILTGDFNLYPSQAGYDVLTGDATSGRTTLHDSLRAVVPVEQPDELTRHAFSGNTSGDRVDYIFFSADLAATQAGILRTAYDGGRFPSDHYPVTATLTLNPARPVITGFNRAAGGFNIEWTTVSGMTYSLRESLDLQSWGDESSVTASGSTATRFLPLMAGGTRRFYRVTFSR